MKFKLIIAVIAALGVTAAYAGNGMKNADRMKAADLDSDGLISLAEFEAAHNARIQEHFARIDTNSDGYLSEDEMQAAGRGRHDMMDGGRHRHDMSPEKALKKLDTDGSGSVSLQEFEGKRFSPDAETFMAADEDGSGELDAGELQAMMQAHWSEMRDTNRDSND